MIGGMVEVSSPGRHLSVHRGFMQVREDGEEVGRVPLDDISALVLAAPHLTLSSRLMTELAERKAVIVNCGADWHPLSMTLPFGVHFQSAGVLSDQIGAGQPLQKRLWQTLVRAKIRHQRVVLEHHAPASGKIADLAVLAGRVKSGDPENMEAQAARHYWRELMGAEFRRGRFAGESNVYLNYGYMVLRAATARAVCGAGLHPSLGLHHRGRSNAFALVDDLMEPYRPIVDSLARDMAAESGDGVCELTPENKRRLAAVLQQDLLTPSGISPLINCLARLAQSLAASLAVGKDELALAEIGPPGQLL